MNHQPYIRAILFLIFFSFILGIGYPLLITGISSVMFPCQSHGSLVFNESGAASGSELIGMNFSGPEYFTGRPSGISPGINQLVISGGSNFGPTSPVLISEVQNRTLVWRENGVSGDIPSDMVMSSASGIDPHLSLESALLQVPFVAEARKLSPERVSELVMKNKNSGPSIFAGSYVHIFSLNRALDQMDTEE